jgi:hypothetical protein
MVTVGYSWLLHVTHGHCMLLMVTACYSWLLHVSSTLYSIVYINHLYDLPSGKHVIKFVKNISILYKYGKIYMCTIIITILQATGDEFAVLRC